MECLEQRIAPATLLFAKQLANHDFGQNLVATDPQGNIVVAGGFTPAIDVDLGPGITNLATPNSTPDVYIAKYTPDGALLWSQTWWDPLESTCRHASLSIL